MNIKKPRGRPEDKAAGRLRRYMENKGWMVKKLHGGKYQSGLPDLVAFHAIHGLRWIETKNIGGKLRVSQRELFADMALHGQKVFILHDQTDYAILFSKHDNWRSYI